jgi:hypothetical protein
MRWNCTRIAGDPHGELPGGLENISVGSARWSPVESCARRKEEDPSQRMRIGEGSERKQSEANHVGARKWIAI